jgi:hypothetical protein
MDRTDFPWRPLGAVLVDEGVVTRRELEHALAEQRESGRLLGQILVGRGVVTGSELARSLARQHGVDVRPSRDGGGQGSDAVQETAPPSAGGRWHSLGMLLAQKGLVAPTALQRALAEQREQPHRRLGEILVERGDLSAPTLAAVLAEQHGVTVETPLVAAEAPAPAPPRRSYEVFELDHASAGDRRRVVYVGASLLDAADFACDYVDRERPPAVEILRRDGRSTETVWTYSSERAAATASSDRSLVETFGFDPTRWGQST